VKLLICGWGRALIAFINTSSFGSNRELAFVLFDRDGERVFTGTDVVPEVVESTLVTQSYLSCISWELLRIALTISGTDL
jgi:hypothetical protein